MTQPRASIAPYEEIPLATTLHRTAARVPDKLAIIDGERQVTFRELDEQSNRFGNALGSIGIGKGDVVGVLSPNCIEFEVAFYGIAKAGAIVSTINSGYREREVANQLDSSAATTLVVHRSLLELGQNAAAGAPDLKRLIVIDEDSRDPDSFWGLVERGSPTPPNIAINPKEDVVALPYSSGTTGLSKGVMLTHYNLTSTGRHMFDRPGEGAAPRADDAFLVHLPLFHIFGINVMMSIPVTLGATQVMMGRFDMDLFLRLLAEHRISTLFTVPPIALGLTQHPDIGKYDLSALRFAFVGGAPLSGELQGHLSDALGTTVLQGYGLTEGPLINIDYIEADRMRPGSVGPRVADTELKVVDVEDAAREMPPGEAGELVVRGSQVMKGYFNNLQATAETITEDGWMQTGDIVSIDDDGYMWVMDRKKELIKYKGFQVPPAELEGLLQEHPDLSDAAVIGKQDVAAGEIPKAFVVVKKGATVSAEDVMGFIAGQVATFKQVREVEFVDEIPKTPSGKILRRVLADRERSRSGT
jgi:acyl-CoA synthetase (AMP-forming)/AMP-acid ligase II